MNEEPLELNKAYVIKHTTRTAQVFVKDLIYRMNVDTIGREDANTLELNEIGRLKLQTSQPLFFDPYQINQKTGSFIIIDPASNVTVGAGMIRAGSTDSIAPPLLEESVSEKEEKTEISPNVVWEPWNIPREDREERNGHKAHVLWFTGISGAGKSTIAKELEKMLWKEGKQTILLDGDQVRHGLNGDLGFSLEDRTENIRRVGETARLFFEHGNIVLCTFVSPIKRDRDRVRSLFTENQFTEIYVKCEPKTAQERDPKGLYQKAKDGEIDNLTGYNAPFEKPGQKHIITLNTDSMSVEESVHILYEHLKQIV